MINLNKKGFLSLIFSYWWLILIVVVLIFLYNFGQNYFNPLYCLTDTTENRASIEVYGFKISDSNINNNQICFRSNKQELVQQMYQSIQNKRLEKEFQLQLMKEENRNKLLSRLFEPMYFYPILLAIVILGIVYIRYKKEKY